MLKARALFYALILMLFIASTSGIFIVSGQVFKQQQTDQFHNLQARYNLNAGISLLKSGAGTKFGTHIPLYENAKDSVFIKRFPWGFIDIGIAMVTTVDLIGKDSLWKIASLGQSNSKLMTPALYLTDSNSPLSVSGNTKIIGNAILPKSGIKKTAIGGIYFQGSEPVAGAITESRGFLPGFNNERLDSILNFRFLQGMETLPSRIVTQSFNDLPLVISGQDIDLTDVQLSGHIIINASNSISISASTILKDVLLFAPEISFEQGFTGNCQAFATKNIILNPEVSLTYPSVLCLTPDDRTYKKASILLAENASLEGQALINSLTPLEKDPQLIIDDNAQITGGAYVNGFTNLAGKMIGSITTKKFLLSTNGSVYTNHLFNTTIDRNSLSQDYIAPCIEKEASSYAIMQWLD